MMNEKISKYIDPIKNFWNKLTKNTRRVIVIVFIGIVALAVVLSLLMNQTKFVVLYPGLDHDEAVEVMTELKDMGVGYKEDSGTIYVPSDQENSLRMQLANEGHPKTAPNYDYFTNNINAMTTDYEKKVIEKYQLNQRLEAVIKTLDPIDNAYVTISIPDDDGYVLDDNKQAATASVTVKIGQGKTLSAKQVNGVKQLVSKSVPNLTADNVSVIDSSSGEELSGEEDDSSSSTQMDLTEFKLKVEKQYEDSIQKKVLNVLVPQYGENNVSVSVTSKMDLDKKIRDIITYQPTTSDGKGIISKSDEETETTTTSSAPGGVAGTQNNADTASSTTTYPGVTLNGNTVTTKDSKSYEYLVSQIEEQIQSDAASLNDLTVSVLINSAAMTDQQRQSIADSVAVAAGGLQPEKVNVRNGAFAAPNAPVSAQPSSAFPMQALIIGGASALLLLVLLIVFLAQRSRKKREELMRRLDLGGQPVPGEEEFPAAEEPGEAVEDENPEFEEMEEAEGEETEEQEEEDENVGAQRQAESIAAIRNTMDEKERQVKKDLEDFSNQNPEIVAQLIRSWLRGDDHHA
jgi:flagellar M-ring protein FliF